MLADDGSDLTPEQQSILDQSSVRPPEGFDSWFEYTVFECDDAVFREWFLNQIRSRRPVGGVSKEIRDILNFALTEEIAGRSTFGGEQKPTHMGFTLPDHLKESVLQLETDTVFNNLGLENDLAKKIRAAARLAMLYHDLGKLLDVSTPGAHEGVGVKFWEKLKPEWVPDDVAQLSAWMIKTHDLFGRLARGLTEKVDGINAYEHPEGTPSYRGALDPSSVKKHLLESGLPFELATQVHEMIWRSDVSSVASLRWLLPVAPMLRELVETTD